MKVKLFCWLHAFSKAIITKYCSSHCHFGTLSWFYAFTKATMAKYSSLNGPGLIKSLLETICFGPQPWCSLSSEVPLLVEPWSILGCVSMPPRAFSLTVVTVLFLPCSRQVDFRFISIDYHLWKRFWGILENSFRNDGWGKNDQKKQFW